MKNIEIYIWCRTSTGIIIPTKQNLGVFGKFSNVFFLSSETHHNLNS